MKKWNRAPTLLGLTLLLALSPLPATAASPLIGTAELARKFAAARPALIDAESKDLYERVHLPGAVNLFYLDLEDAEENAKSGLPIFPQLAASKFGGLGISADTEVVVYDRGDGRAASAVWYVLRYLGHDKVQILDGGLRKWLKEGRPLTQETPKVAKAIYKPKPRPDWALKTADLARSQALVVDARSLGEYSGKDAGGARQGGHIPGAKSFVWERVAAPLATFPDARTMRTEFKKAGITPEREIVLYCNGGLGRSTYLFAALTALGYEKVRVYPGSWLEWAADPARPIER